MKTLVINCGNPPLKYQLIDMENEGVVAERFCERIGTEGSKLTHQPFGRDEFVIEKPMPAHRTAIEMAMKALQNADHRVVKDTSEISAIGHHVLHGGTVYSDPIVVSRDVKRVIRGCFNLGPLHNPANLTGVEAYEVAMSETSNVAVFDTAFGMSVPEKAYMYVIPYEYSGRYGVRRYGFRGISHRFVSVEATKFGGLDPKAAKVIMRRLGDDSSMSAPIDGKYVGTNVELTSLEGLIMGTRSGDVDPAVFQFIMNKRGLDISKILNILNKKSSVHGTTNGIPSDFRDIESAKAGGNYLVEVALDTFIYRVTEYVGTYATAMNGVDAITFIAGVSENGKTGRKAICENPVYTGVKVDDELSSMRGEERVIPSADSRIEVMLILTNKELAIVREALDLVQ